MRALRLLPLLVLLLPPAALAQMLPVTTASEEARAHFERGRHQAFHYQFARAIEHLDAALAADSGFVLALLHRAGSSLPDERPPYFDQALAHSDRVSEGERRMVDAFLAFLHPGHIDVERAVGILRGLSDEYPNDPYLPTYLGLRYYRNLQRYDEAAAQFRRALERDPTFAQAYNWLGYVALDQGDYAAAEEAFEQYARLAPDQPRPHDSLGELYLRTGRYGEAARQFERALELDPDFTVSRDKLVRARIAQANERFEAAFARQDAAAVAALYTEDAMVFPQGRAPTMGGRAAVRDFWEGLFGAGFDGIELTTLDVRQAGDVAYERGIATVRQRGSIALVADYTALWHGTPDGWQIHHDVITPTGGAASLTRADAVEWVEVIPGIAFASVYGDWGAGAHGKLIRFAPGAAAPMHTHTHPYRGVVLSGSLTNPYANEDDPPVMGPGDAWYVPGGTPHSNACVSEEPCLFYTYGDAAWDIEVVEN